MAARSELERASRMRSALLEFLAGVWSAQQECDKQEHVGCGDRTEEVRDEQRPIRVVRGALLHRSEQVKEDRPHRDDCRCEQHQARGRAPTHAERALIWPHASVSSSACSRGR